MDPDKQMEKLEEEEKKSEENLKKKFFSEKWFKNLGVIVLVFAAVGAFAFWRDTAGRVSIENSYIEAQAINLSPSIPGVLSDIYVKEGQTISANAPVAKVGNQVIISRVPGVVTYASKQIGQYFNPGSTVISMFNPADMQVVGKIDENKGLSDIAVGQPVSFTVDAFGSRVFYGVVSEVSSVSDDPSVMFTISDQRPVRQFDVKADFDVSKYDFLKPGMSAKMTVFVK